MAENNTPEVSYSDQVRIRREKLAQLQQEGRDPFRQTKFVVSAYSTQIKEHFDEMEGSSVTIAGRLMSKRGMGKVSFCDLQDRYGRIQLYARRDEMDEESYDRFKNTISAISSVLREKCSGRSAAK